MPQTMLNSAYREDKDRYDYFNITIDNNEPFHISPHLWKEMVVGKKYQVTLQVANPELSLIKFLKQINNQTVDVKEIM